jgi:hypothetical protein
VAVAVQRDAEFLNHTHTIRADNAAAPGGARPNYQNVIVPDRAGWQTFWPLSYVFDFALA